jgi:hypothetical protein
LKAKFKAYYDAKAAAEKRFMTEALEVLGLKPTKKNRTLFALAFDKCDKEYSVTLDFLCDLVGCM